MVDCVVCNADCDACQGAVCMHNIPLLSNLDSDEIDKISAGVVVVDYKKGEYIFRTGDEADRLYIVCSGRMKIFNYLSDGREQILYIYSAGDFVGAFNLLKKDKYKYNSQALEDTTIITLSKNKFDEIAMKNPAITLKILEKAYERIRWAEELVARLSSGNADAKVAGLLLNLMDDFGREIDGKIVLDLSINREEMGSYAGMSRETMSRKLSQFREEGYIDFSGSKKIIILKRDKLEELL